jgi:hypothetical protein
MPGSQTGKLEDPAWRQARATKAARARTTGSYHLDRVRDFVTRSRAAQGLGPAVTDDLTLGEIASLIEEAGPDAA